MKVCSLTILFVLYAYVVKTFFVDQFGELRYNCSWYIVRPNDWRMGMPRTERFLILRVQL